MLFFVTVTVLVASANAKFYTDCGSKLATVQNVTVSGCADAAKECALRRNTNITFGIEFTPSLEIQQVETMIYAVVKKLPVPFPPAQPDACIDTGLTCPLQADKKATYSKTIPILKSYPKVKVTVKWELKNENDEDIVCITIPAQIQ